MFPFEDTPWWIWPLEFTMLCSFGAAPILVTAWGLNTNLVDLQTWWHWALWLYFGPMGFAAFLGLKIKNWLDEPSY